jgi:hypothetical protein
MQLPTVLTAIVASLAFAAAAKPTTSAMALTSSIPAVLFMPSAALPVICVRGDTCFELHPINAKWGGDDNKGLGEDGGDPGASVNTTKIASGAGHAPALGSPSANMRGVCFSSGRCYENGVRVTYRRRLEGADDGTALKCVPRDYGLKCDSV